MIALIKLLSTLLEHHLSFRLVSKSDLLPEAELSQHLELFLSGPLINRLNQIVIDNSCITTLISFNSFLHRPWHPLLDNDFFQLFKLSPPLDSRLAVLLLLSVVFVEADVVAEARGHLVTGLVLLGQHLSETSQSMPSLNLWIKNLLKHKLLHFFDFFF